MTGLSKRTAPLGGNSLGPLCRLNPIFTPQKLRLLGDVIAQEESEKASSNRQDQPSFFSGRGAHASAPAETQEQTMVVETKATPSNGAKLEVIDLRGISDGEDAFPQMKQSGKKHGPEGKSALGLERGRLGRKLKMGADQSKVKTGGSVSKGGAKGGTPVLKKKKDEGASGLQKRGPGRPKKEDESQKRGPGRPRKEEETQKRGPGRPKKEDEGQKKGPGRPKRDEPSPKGGAEKPASGAEKPKAGADKRGPGRPRREDEKTSKGVKGKPGRKPLSLQLAKEKSSPKGSSVEKPGIKRKAAAEEGSGAKGTSSPKGTSSEKPGPKRKASEAGDGGKEAKRLKGEKGEAKGRWPGKAGEVQAKPGSSKAGLANKGEGFKGVKSSGKGPKKSAEPVKAVQVSAAKKGGVRAAFEAVRTLRNSKVLGTAGADTEGTKEEEGAQQKMEPQLRGDEKVDEEVEKGAEDATPGSGEGDANEARSSEATESDREEAPGAEEEVKGPVQNGVAAAEQEDQPPAEAPAERKSFVQAALSGLFSRSKTAEVGTLELVVEPELPREEKPEEEQPPVMDADEPGKDKQGLPQAVTAGAEDETAGAASEEGEKKSGGEECLRVEQLEEAPSGEGVAVDVKEAGPLIGLAETYAAPVAEAEAKAAESEEAPVVTVDQEPLKEELIATEKVQEEAPVAPPPSTEVAEPVSSLTPEKTPAAEEGAEANVLAEPDVASKEEEGSKLVLRLEPEEGKVDTEEKAQEGSKEKAVLDDRGEDSGLEKMGEEVEVGLEVTGPERDSGFGSRLESKPQDWGGDKEGGSGATPNSADDGTGADKIATRGLGKRERVPVTRFFEEEEAPQRAKAEKPATKTKGGFKCDICGMVFGNGQALGGHKGSHKLTDAFPVRQPPPSDPEPPPAPRGYECDLCGLVFPNGQKLGGHKSSHKAVESLTAKPQGAAVPEVSAVGFTCDICGLVFANGQALGGHKGSHKPTDAYTEEEKRANTKKGTRGPFQKEKKSPKSPPVKERPVEEFVPLGWPCEICGLVFPTGQALGGHKGSHKATYYYTDLEKPSPRPPSAAPRSARLLRRLEEKASEGDANADGGSSDENGSLRRARLSAEKRSDGVFMGRAKLPMSLRPKDRLQSLAAIVSKKSRRIVSSESLGEEEREKNSKRIVERLKRTAGGGGGPASPQGQKGKGMDSFEEDAVAGLMVLRHAADNAPARPERHRRKRSRVKSSPTGAPSMNVPPEKNDDESTLAAAKVLVGKTGVLGELEAEELEEDDRERTVSDDDAFSSGAEKIGREERQLLTSLGVGAGRGEKGAELGLSSGGTKRGDPSGRDQRGLSLGRGRRRRSPGQSSGGDKSEEDKPRRPETRTKEERRVTRKLRDSSDEEEVWRPRIRERGLDGKREKKGGEKKQRQKPLTEVVAQDEALPSKEKESAPSKPVEPAKPTNPLAGWIKRLKEGTLFGGPRVASPAAGAAAPAADASKSKKEKDVTTEQKEAHSDGESYSSDEPLAGAFRVPPSKRPSHGGITVSPVVTAPGGMSPPLPFSIPVMEEVPGGKGPAELSDEEMEQLPLSALKVSKKKSVLGAGLLGDVPFKRPELGGKAEPALGKKFKALTGVGEVPKLAKLNLLIGLPVTGLVAPGLIGKGEIAKKGTDGVEKEKKKRKRREDPDGEGKKRKKKSALADESRSGSPPDEGKSGFGLGMKRPWQPALLRPAEFGGFRPFVPEVSAQKVVDALKGVRKGPKKAPKSGGLEKSLLGRPESDSGDEDAPIGLLSKMRSPEKKAPEKKAPERKTPAKKPVKGLVPEPLPRDPVEELKKPRKRRRKEEGLRTVKLGDGILALPANGGSNASDPGSLTEANSGSESEDVPIGRRVGGYTEITQERPNHVNLEEEIQRAVQESVAMLQQINEEQEQEARRRKLKKEERAARKKRRKEAGEGLRELEEKLAVVGVEKAEGKPPRSKSKSKRNKDKSARPATPLTPSQELPLFADAVPSADVPSVRLGSPSQPRSRHVSSSMNEFLEKLGLGDFAEKAWSRKKSSRAASDAFGRSSDAFGRGADDLGRASSVRPSYTVLTEEEEFEHAILQSKLNREELSAAYLALKSALDTGRVPAPETQERFDLNTGLSLGGPSRGATPSPAPFMQALREGGLRNSSTPPLGRESRELGAFFRDKGVVKNGKWLPMHHPGEKDVLGGEPRAVDLGRESEGLWGRSASHGQPDLPAVKTGLAQFLRGGMDGRGLPAGVARASSHDSHDRPLLDKTLDLNLAVPLSNRSSPTPSSLSLPPLVAPTWTNLTEKELLSRDWELPTWLPPQLEGRRDSFSNKPYAPPRFSPRDQTGVSGPPLFNGPQPDVWKNKKDLDGLLNPERPWPNLLGQRQEAMTPAGGGDVDARTGFLGKGGSVARRESPGFLELRVLSPSVQDQPLFSEKELMESRAQGLVMGGVSKDPPQTHSFLRRDNVDLIKSADTLRRLLGKNENMTSPAIRSYAEGVNKMLMEGSKLLPDPEGQTNPQHHDVADSTKRSFVGVPAAFFLQRTASGADAEQRTVPNMEQEKPKSSPLPGWLEIERQRLQKE
ncbi:hypothetical protein KFL_003130060 [Klebsormidium nitens]|uniref:C2H2-type domain-containing protein n=1 Tax=Klebsormidium nitens TaxID=105231 RepID=A0A1Y1IDL7_KLENI|nr:hypothetical protein KFL_003130060 [Klebsormidium nitens]|eukprot:GAQ86817.1 hypothetical protein KFL_003130060 [Klebsormidium nitens]